MNSFTSCASYFFFHERVPDRIGPRDELSRFRATAEAWFSSNLLLSDCTPLVLNGQTICNLSAKVPKSDYPSTDTQWLRLILSFVAAKWIPSLAREQIRGSTCSRRVSKLANKERSHSRTDTVNSAFVFTRNWNSIRFPFTSCRNRLFVERFILVRLHRCILDPGTPDESFVIFQPAGSRISLFLVKVFRNYREH